MTAFHEGARLVAFIRWCGPGQGYRDASGQALGMVQAPEGTRRPSRSGSHGDGRLWARVAEELVYGADEVTSGVVRPSRRPAFSVVTVGLSDEVGVVYHSGKVVRTTH